jgi:LssY C-terminus
MTRGGSGTRSPSRSACCLAVVLISLGLASCAGPRSTQILEPSFEARAVTRQRDGLAVTAVALSAEESRAVFNAPLAVFNIQPVWIEIDNPTPWPRWFFPISVDPDYYPPYEVARRVAFSKRGIERLYALLSERAIEPFVTPGATISGFVYAHADEGFKAFNVDLVGNKTIESFNFTVPVPGMDTDDHLIGDELDAPRRSLDDGELRRWLTALPCCTQAADARPGDPLNIVLVGDLDAVRSALVSERWDVTARLTRSSLWRIATAFVFGSRYRYAPISGLYVFGRIQDMTFQKSRNIIDERNHIRLWLAPVSHRGQPVWIGHISRDVGVKLSGRVWPPTTHVIDPDVDDARFYLLQDLLYGGQVRRVGFVDGVGPAPLASPRLNAEEDPYFTDGLRAVVFLSDEFVPFADIELLDWELPEVMQSLLQDRLPRPVGATDPEPD